MALVIDWNRRPRKRSWNLWWDADTWWHNQCTFSVWRWGIQSVKFFRHKFRTDLEDIKRAYHFANSMPGYNELSQRFKTLPLAWCIVQRYLFLFLLSKLCHQRFKTLALAWFKTLTWVCNGPRRNLLRSSLKQRSFLTSCLSLSLSLLFLPFWPRNKLVEPVVIKKIFFLKSLIFLDVPSNRNC